MKAVILAGGLGTRLSEETDARPKPMVELGAKPMLWHVLQIYSRQGVNDFVICCGYRGYVIKEFFANYFLHTCDVVFDLEHNQMEVLASGVEPWRVALIDTGESTMTGGRLRRVLAHVEGEEAFHFTYGDGLADLDLDALVAHHRRSGGLATVTAVQPPGRFGALRLERDRVTGFQEKPEDGGWINGGFFVLSPEVGRYIDGDETAWEAEPLQRLAAEGQLFSYQHVGFWYAMDTLRDKRHLEGLVRSGEAPWIRAR